MKTPTKQRSTIAWRVLLAIGILLATWLLMGLAQGIPTLCAFAYPCPAPDVRVAPAFLFGGLVTAPTLALILTARVGKSWGALSYVVLVGLAVIGLGAVLFSGGFTVPFV